MTVFEKLAKRIKEDLNLEVVGLKRTYAGKHMRGSGAPVWDGKVKGTNIEVAGCWSATELVRKKEPLERSLFWPPFSGCIEIS